MRNVFAMSMAVAGVLFASSATFGARLADGDTGGKRPVFNIVDGDTGGKRPVLADGDTGGKRPVLNLTDGDTGGKRPVLA